MPRTQLQRRHQQREVLAKNYEVAVSEGDEVRATRIRASIEETDALIAQLTEEAAQAEAGEPRRRRR